MKEEIKCKNEGCGNTLQEVIYNYMAQLSERGHFSTSKSYLDALRSFGRFVGGREINMGEIGRELLRSYQEWLVGLGRARNTISTYMRRLRHICRLSMESGEMDYDPHLFEGIFTGVESRRKRALPEVELREVMRPRLDEERIHRVRLAARLMFAFSGMAFVDLAHLRRENIRDGLLTYHRRKSGSLIRVEIPAEAMAIVEELSVTTGKESPYLFPFLSGERVGEAAFKEYRTALSRFNRELGLLARAAGVSCKFSSYTIRHSFATTLKERGVPIEVISELLGHRSIATTQIYLKSFSLERLSAVNRAAFESLGTASNGGG